MNFIERTFTPWTLLITAYEYEELKVKFLSEKVVFYTDENNPEKSYIETERLYIDNTVFFTNPYKTDKTAAFLKKLQEERRFRIYRYYQVESIYGHPLLITLDTPQGMLELEGTSFQQQTVWLPNAQLSELNKHTCEQLKLKTCYKEEEQEKGVYNYKYKIELPPDIRVHTVEVKGQNMPVVNPVYNNNDVTDWSPAHDLMIAHTAINYDYENKMIYTEYNNHKKTGRGRRNSNGWLTEYVTRRAQGIRYFDTRYEMKIYLENIINTLENEGFKVKTCTNHTYKGTASYYSLEFMDEVPYYKLHHILKMTVTGIEISEEI